MTGKPRQIFLILGFAGGLAGCETFDVNLETPEPIKVDVTMNVHVYQYEGVSEVEKEKLTNYKDVVERQRNRMAEVQTLKDNRLIGENHLGLLDVRSLPAGDYGAYVKKTVDEENADRVFLMTRNSGEKGEALAETQRREGQKRRDASFPDEWIEIEGDEPGTYRWVKKS